MKKNILPLLLIAGAAIAFMAYRRRPRVTVTADAPIIQREAEFQEEFRTAPSAAQVIQTGSKLITDLFKKKAGAKAQRTAVKRAVRTKTATKKQAKAVTKELAKGIRFAGFGDNVLV